MILQKKHETDFLYGGGKLVGTIVLDGSTWATPDAWRLIERFMLGDDA